MKFTIFTDIALGLLQYLVNVLVDRIKKKRIFGSSLEQ